MYKSVHSSKCIDVYREDNANILMFYKNQNSLRLAIGTRKIKIALQQITGYFSP